MSTGIYKHKPEHTEKRRLTQLGKNSHFYKHGGYGTRVYKIWQCMKARCYNSNNNRYHRYGGRGITVCSEWLEFAPFRDWALSNGYKEGLSIDRIDNGGNYEPDNCQWLTNGMNKRKDAEKRVIQYNFDSSFVAEFVSTMKAARLTGVYQGNISRVCNGSRKTAGGFIWEYVGK